ncbi:RDAC family protein [Tannockella kyphosi]|uniref:RDAC family protein n=1 Tax=Tannockella kyphosi TaxID=2899121 RepID=UPI0020122CED|nr:hypothetical protein [Tannockella kyphosi]
MANVVHFNKIVEINQALKQAGLSCSIHAVGGCTCCGLELRSPKAINQEEAILIINQCLKEQWLYVYPDGQLLRIESKFKKLVRE